MVKAKPKNRRSNREKKLRVGERFGGTVRDLTSSGDGVVAHPNGQVFFVSGVWPGEHGEFRISEFRGRSGLAELCALDQASPERVEPPCPHHGFATQDCGGCPWQFISYTQQLSAKQARLARALESVDTGAAIRAIWPSPDTLGYRNRAQLKTDGAVMGFVSRGRNQIAPIDDCLVLNAENRKTLKTLALKLPNRDWRPAKLGPWTTLDIDDDIDADAVVPNRRRPFRQGNSAQNQRMQQWLGERLREHPADGPVLELFAGAGNFTEVIRRYTEADITAVDSFAPALEQLNARGLPGVRTRTLGLHRNGVAAELADELAAARLLVLDPPREGLRHCEAMLKQAAKLHSVFYISCDLATFTRDCAAFLAGGFTLIELQPLDMFPHTPHIETLALLRR
jgi:23S rRNA (uracil1939-C5)-methyltransferase